MPLRLPAALLAVLSGALAALVAIAAPAQAAAFTDAAGRRVILPDHIGRVLPAERNAEVLVFVLAPEKLVGLEGISGRAGRLPRGAAVLRWRPRSSPASMAATARQLGADVIIDAGPVTPQTAAFADQVQQQTGIPYILVDDSVTRIPRILRGLGALLATGERANDLAQFAEHAIDFLRGRLLVRPANTRQRIYYGLGPDGLTTPLPGSPAAQVLEEAGTINVAAARGRGTEVRISAAELLSWDPEIIIAERRSFYDSVRRNRRLSAVRSGRVYLEPGSPFGWIEGPPGINRLIGLYWLAGLLYPEATQDDLRSAAWRSIACDFYDKFYRIRLTNAQLEAILRSAGAPPRSQDAMAQAAAGAVGPQIGLGTAPPRPMPSDGAATAAPIELGGAMNATCSVPTASSPKQLPGLTTAPGPTPLPVAPGVPPAGQRGRPPG